MSRRDIDLLPLDIHARNAAGLVMARCASAAIVTVFLLVMTITHSQLMKERARQSLGLVRSQADLVHAAEMKEAELSTQLEQAQKHIREYRSIATPLEVSGIVATAVNLLPPSVTLERLEVDSGQKPTARSARTPLDSRSPDRSPRVLNGELSGFAGSDQDITDLVAQMKRTPPFEGVSLDFSRSRVVRGRGAREFRLSFRIDLDQTYVVSDAGAEANASASGDSSASGGGL